MKGLTTGLLLLFVVVSVIFLIAKGQGNDDAFADSGNNEVTSSNNSGSSVGTGSTNEKTETIKSSGSIANTLDQRSDISPEIPSEEIDNVSDKQETAVDNKKVVSYYFYVSRRCYACVQMQEASKIAIDEGFQEAVRSGLLEYRAVNLDDRENRHYLTAFQLRHPTIILAVESDGEIGEWVNLAKIWQLYRNMDALVGYIQETTREFIQTNL